ncbi:hypothetical protein GQR58_005198 [Nymphon striatum]|nr:hypothetical protein GQR58_005198 [Nymphon striatum]
MKNFLKDTSGNVAVTVALLGIPLMLSAGAAVDYSQYARKQSSLQNVVDSAALAVALDLQSSTQAEIETKVDNFLKSNLTTEQYSEVQGFVVTIPPNKEKVTVEKLCWFWIQPGSMALDGKMDALKISANKFVEDVLKSNTLEERVKIGITPFARYVNVGMDNRNASWMDVPADYTTTETIETRDVISSSGCSETTYIDSEGIERTTTSCTDVEYGPVYEKEITRTYKWNGCAGSRNYPRNLDDSDFSYKVPGLLNAWCPNRITQLTAG